MWQFVSSGAGCGLLAVGTAGAVVWWYAASSYPSEQRAARQNPVGARSGPAVVAPPLSLGLASLESLTFLHCSRSAEPGPGPGGSSKTLPQTDHSANQPGSGPEQNGDTYYRFAAPSQAKPFRYLHRTVYAVQQVLVLRTLHLLRSDESMARPAFTFVAPKCCI